MALKHQNAQNFMLYNMAKVADHSKQWVSYHRGEVLASSVSQCRVSPDTWPIAPSSETPPSWTLQLSSPENLEQSAHSVQSAHHEGPGGGRERERERERKRKEFSYWSCTIVMHIYFNANWKYYSSTIHVAIPLMLYLVWIDIAVLLNIIMKWEQISQCFSGIVR